MNKYLLAGILAVGVAGCSDADKAEKAAAEEAIAEFDLLSLVPADSPYVFASSRKPPLELSEKLLKASTVEFDDGSYRRDLASTIADIDADAAGLEMVKLMDAFLAELEGKMSAEGLASLGLPTNGRTLFYGLGMLPVAWTEILDAGKVEAFLARVEERSGIQAEKLTRGDISYRRFEQDKLVGILAVGKDHLIMALLPAKSETDLLPLVFGEAKPEKSLADTGSFKEFSSKRKFLGYGGGYLDLVRMAEMALGESRGINAQVLGISPKELSAACQDFIKTTVQSVPMISLGVTEMTKQKYAVKATVETSPGVAGWLQKMSAPVPGVGVPNDGMISFGMGFDLPQIRDGVKAMLRNFLETGKGCELVNEEELAQAMQGVDVAFNPMLLGMGVKGFSVIVNDAEVDVQTMTPKAIDAQMLLAAADPKSMFSMAGMLSPQLAQMDIPVDGTAVQVPLEGVFPMAPPTFAAIKGQVLALMTGEKAPDGMDKVLSAPVADVPPFFSLSYDVGKLFQTIGPPMKNMVESTQGNSAVYQSMQSSYKSLETAAGIYTKFDFRVLGTERGLEIDAVVNME